MARNLVGPVRPGSIVMAARGGTAITTASSAPSAILSEPKSSSVTRPFELANARSSWPSRTLAPLLSSNCKSTSVDDDWVAELIGLRTEPAKAQTKTEEAKSKADAKVDKAKSKADAKVDKAKAKADAKTAALPAGSETAKAATDKGADKAKGAAEKGKAKARKHTDKAKEAADKATK